MDQREEQRSFLRRMKEDAHWGTLITSFIVLGLCVAGIALAYGKI